MPVCLRALCRWPGRRVIPGSVIRACPVPAGAVQVALDGYFSIAAVLLGNRLLLRHQNRASQARTMQSIAA
ncbi:MAG: hypothetical protein R3D53_11095 [Paracoccaceae bacterium]